GATLGWWLWSRPQQRQSVIITTRTPTPGGSPVATLAPTVAPGLPASPKLATSVLASITLVGGGVRTGSGGQDTPMLKLTPATTLVEMKLILLEDNFPHYRAVLQDQTGKTVWRAASLKARAKVDGVPAIVVQVPAGLFR